LSHATAAIKRTAINENLAIRIFGLEQEV
jgi:hypothetical protein